MSLLIWNGEVRPVDIATFAYLLATVGILRAALRSLDANREMVNEMRLGRLAGDRASRDAMFRTMLDGHRETVRDLADGAGSDRKQGLDVLTKIMWDQKNQYRSWIGRADKGIAPRPGDPAELAGKFALDNNERVLGALLP